MEKRHLVGTGFDHALWTRRATYGMSFLLQEARYRLCGWSLCAEVRESVHVGSRVARCIHRRNGMPGAPAAPTCTTRPRASRHIRSFLLPGLRRRRPTDPSIQTCINPDGTFTLSLLLVFVTVHSGRSTLFISTLPDGSLLCDFIGQATADCFHSSKIRCWDG